MDVAPVHFYHCFTGRGSNWESIRDEHMSALESAGFEGAVVENAVSEGWEQATLIKLHEFAVNADPATPIFYAHTKGSMYGSEDMHTTWRRCLTRQCAGRWRECVAALREHDMAGAHYLARTSVCPTPIYAGNFWWATAGFVASRPRIDPDCNRYYSEVWLGEGKPKAFDFGGGYPTHPCRLGLALYLCGRLRT